MGVENSAPNGGDGNGDGLPDGQQPNVTSLPSATGLGFITLVVNGSCAKNRNVQALTDASQGSDPGFDYPFGLVSFDLPCSRASVEVIFHGAATLEGATYRKFGPTPPGFDEPRFYTLPDVTFGTRVIAGQTVATATFILRDGNVGDDTPIDGTIIDQGGPGVPSFTPAPMLSAWVTLAVVLGLALLGGLPVACRRWQLGARNRDQVA